MDVSTVKSAPVTPKPPPKQAESVERVAEQAARRQASAEKAEPTPKPSPVVNTQGQQTGRLLNVVA